MPRTRLGDRVLLQRSPNQISGFLPEAFFLQKPYSGVGEASDLTIPAFR
jgi:hypothetical protein